MNGFTCNAQLNLVPNPSFEDYDNCEPWGLGGEQICTAEPWFQPFNYSVQNCGGSTELYHSCTNVIPNNFGGYQFPASGNGMAGGTSVRMSATGISNDWREYLEIKLITSLNNSRHYCVNWSTNLANISRYASNRVGAYFSPDTIFQTGSQYDYINVIPQVENLSINADTLNWSEFHQSFIAQGGEQFMTVGNFRPGSMVDTSEIINPSGAWAYYYFDDFGVYLLPEIDAGTGGEICNFGQSVQLQASCTDCWDGLQYRWWPQEGLSDPDSLNTIATPSKTTTYYFGLIDPTETVPCIVDLVDSVTVTVCDGVVPTGFDFAIVPNPSSDQVKLVFSQQTEVTTLKLYDARGRLIREEDIPANSISYVLNIEELSAGQYSIELRNPSGEAHQKLVKM